MTQISQWDRDCVVKLNNWEDFLFVKHIGKILEMSMQSKTLAVNYFLFILLIKTWYQLISRSHLCNTLENLSLHNDSVVHEQACVTYT